MIEREFPLRRLPLDEVDRVGLAHVEGAGIVLTGADAADVLERYRHHAIADRHLEIGHDVGEVEAEGQVLARVPVVVDMDLVDGIGFQIEVVRAAVGILQGAGSWRSA